MDLHELRPASPEAFARWIEQESVLLPGTSIVRIQDEGRTKYVILYTGSIMAEGKEIILSMCTHQDDGHGRKYPLLRSMQPENLGDLTEYLDRDDHRALYQAVLWYYPGDLEILPVIRAVESLKQFTPRKLDEFSVRSAYQKALREWELDQTGGWGIST